MPPFKLLLASPHFLVLHGLSQHSPTLLKHQEEPSFELPNCHKLTGLVVAIEMNLKRFSLSALMPFCWKYSAHTHTKEEEITKLKNCISHAIFLPSIT